MKLSAFAFRRFYELHAWVGVLTGLVLYVMFIAGGFTLFHEPLEQWEDPLAQRQVAPRTLQQQLDQGLTALGRTPDTVWFSPAEERGEPGFDWQDASGTWQAARFDSTTGHLVPQRERLAHFTYTLHYLWHDLTGQWLYTVAGLLSLVWLVVIVTGVLVHLKDVARQFHQFRPEKQGRLFWSDLHKVLGTMGLPFQTVFAWSGAFMVLGPLVVRLFVGPVFGGDEHRAQLVSAGYGVALPEKPGAVVPVLSVDTLVERAHGAMPELHGTAYRFINHGRDNGRFEIWGRGNGSPRGQLMVQLDEVSGEVVTRSEFHAASELRRWLMGLHFAQFGGAPVRLLFLLLTLASCVTIISGNWIWLSRRASSPHRKVSRLTVGVGAGAWVAFGVLLLASRVLPWSLPHRGHVEELAFFFTLVGCIAWAALVRDERLLWRQQLALAAGLWVVVPVFAALHSSSGLFGAGPRVAEVLGVDVVVLLLGVGLGLSALASPGREKSIAPVASTASSEASERANA